MECMYVYMYVCVYVCISGCGNTCNLVYIGGGGGGSHVCVRRPAANSVCATGAIGRKDCYISTLICAQFFFFSPSLLQMPSLLRERKEREREKKKVHVSCHWQCELAGGFFFGGGVNVYVPVPYMYLNGKTGNEFFFGGGRKL